MPCRMLQVVHCRLYMTRGLLDFNARRLEVCTVRAAHGNLNGQKITENRQKDVRGRPTKVSRAEPLPTQWVVILTKAQ